MDRISDNYKDSSPQIGDWYNGYHTASGERVYNPRSVVADEVRDNLVRMISGAAVPEKIEEYAATSMNMQT